METDKNSVVTMEEPEAHAFPYYTEHLAGVIALDAENQYFVTTHNPYFLSSLLEKADKESTRVFITASGTGRGSWRLWWSL